MSLNSILSDRHFNRLNPLGLLFLVVLLVSPNFLTAQDAASANTATAVVDTAKAPAAAGAGDAAAIAEGEKLYKANCTSCHAIDKKVVGPALKGVHERRSSAWLVKWIRNNNKLRESGDKDAQAIYAEYNNSPMTLFENLSEGQVLNIVEYIKAESNKQPVVAAGTTPAGAAPTAEEESVPNWLIVLVAILVFAVLNLLILIENKVSKLSGKPVFDWNQINAVMFIITLIGGLYYVIAYFFKYTPYTYFAVGSASEHGKGLDEMFMLTLAITGIVFFICQILAFVFAYQYRHRGAGTKAFYYPDNHKIEFWWTVVPAVVLVGLLLYGLRQWGNITKDAPVGVKEIEVYGRQFDWTARYAGKDKQLGKSNFKLIESPNNLIGVDFEQDPKGADDILSQGELHLIVNEPVLLRFRARDVIHSAFIPHMRLQMNVVPGMPTQFFFTPTVSTEEMRKLKNDPKFDYMLLCNKICGNAHYNMKMKVIVEKKSDFIMWYGQQKPIVDPSAKVTVAPSDTSKQKPTAMVN